MPGMRPTLGAAHGMHPTQPKVNIHYLNCYCDYFSRTKYSLLTIKI